MPEIRQLTASVINKIAAGEVIERPASVVKELLENAVDSGATRIELSIAQGGMELVRVADNGCGIAADQLTLAVASHATSKIRDADDLFQVATLGFRGEALASIAEISRFQIRSRQAESTSGAQMEVNAGTIGPVEPCGCAVGTMIEVRDLFCNTPVRRKFVRTSQTEVGHCTEAFTRIALSYPRIHFVMRSGERVLFDVPPTDAWRDRIAAFFGAEMGDGLIAVDGDDSGVRLTGYVADPNFSRGNNRLQYLFLNGRCIRDRSLQHALSEAYRGLLLTGRFPIAFLRLQMPLDMVDVNVHPTKMEVRFQDSGRIYSQLLGAVRRKFLATDLTPKIRPASSPNPEQEASGIDRQQAQQQRRELLDWARGASSQPPESVLPSAGPGETAGPGTAGPGTMRPDPTRPAGGVPPFKPFDSGFASLLSLTTPPPGSRSGSPAPPPHEDPFADAADDADLLAASRPPAPPHGPHFGRSPDAHSPVDLSGAPMLRAVLKAPPAAPPSASPHAISPQSVAPWPPSAAATAGASYSGDSFSAGAGGARESNLQGSSPRGAQFLNRYLVTEDESGLVVIDQHALHERILYEQLRTKVENGKIETQRLLVPEPVQLTPPEAAAALEVQEPLRQIGVEIEPFGGDTVLVTGYPSMLARLRPGEVLRQVVDRLMAGGKAPDRRELVDELLHMFSCKAAVKAGDRLQPEEIQALLEQRHLFHDTHHCPHGRPTALVFTREELDKRFKRI